MNAYKNVGVRGVLKERGEFSSASYEELVSSASAFASKAFTPLGCSEWERHTEAVVSILDDISREVASKKKLNSVEAFLALATAWTHSLGIEADGIAPASHGVAFREPASEIVRRHHRALGLPRKRVADLVASLIDGLQRKRTFNDVFPKDETVLISTPVRVRFVAAMVAIAVAFDCTYTRRLPANGRTYHPVPGNEGGWRWRAYQVISGVKFEPEEGKVEVHGSPESEDERLLFLRELSDLQAELDRCLPHLVTNGVSLLYAEGILNSREVVDARGLRLEASRDQEQKLERFFDLHTTYKIDVVGRSDLQLRREVEFLNGSQGGVDRRRHFFYSDSSIFEPESETVRAWSGKRRLQVEAIRGAPARIEFDIVFHHAVPCGGSYQYSYDIFWPHCFPADHEFFTGNDYGLSVRFELSVPRGFKVTRLGCSEILADGSHRKIRETEQPLPDHRESARQTYIVSVSKGSRNSNTMLYWDWERPEVNGRSELKDGGG